MASKITSRDNSKEWVNFFNKAKHRGLTAIGLMAEKYAKKNCPVDTGLLRNSITYAIAGYEAHVKQYRRDNFKTGESKKHTYKGYDGVMDGKKDEAVYIGTNVDYAPYKELGARGKTGLFFLRKAATEHASEYGKIMKGSLENA